MANENTQPEPIQITFAKGTDIGRARDHNEDYVDAFSPSEPNQRRQKGYLFIVADGMGGHQAGEVASEGAVRVISREYYADPDPDVRGSLIRAIKKANALIHQQAQQMATRIGMGTTVVAAVVRERELYLANVGDSRAYLMRQGQVNQVTHDHSFVAEQIRAGILTPEEARTHPQRNVITRALGSKPEVQVDTYSGELKPGDVLLLCSDGLSEYAHEEDMAALLGQHPPEEAVPRLIALANKRGGSDNISTLVVRASPPAGVTARKPAAPAARRAAAPPRKRSALPWIIGIGTIVVIAVAALVAGVLFVPSLFGEKETPTPTAPPPATPTVATATATPLPTSTPRSTAGAPTVTPATELRLLGPSDGATFRPGQDVNFRWEWIGALPEPFTFVVTTTAGVLCQSSQESCIVALSAGVYEWWVELRAGGQVFRSEPQTLYVNPPPTAVPMPTFSPIPTESPLPSPPPSGGEGSDKPKPQPTSPPLR